MDIRIFIKYCWLIPCLLLWGDAQGQGVPPDFICVENDTLKWLPPSPPCPDFNGYDVYYSAAPEGPYSLLASVADPLGDSHYHSNANSANNLWYYYIVTDCGGQASLSSDTLDNRDPDFPPIDAVTVTNGQVEIFWTPSQAPETAGYTIFQETANGSFAEIATITPGTASYYLDTASDPSLSPQEYTIVAFDACGNTSIFNTAPQESILLAAGIDACTQAATLTWNPYKNWPEGTQHQEVWVGVNGAPAEVVDTIPAEADSYVYENLDDGNEYCFTLRADRENSDFYAESNTTCLIADIVQPNRNLSLQTVSFMPDDRIELIWRWDTNSEINLVEVLASAENGGYAPIGDFPPDFPLTATDTSYVPAPNHNGNEAKQFFQIRSTDDCGATSTSNYGATIFLTAESTDEQTNALEWTAFDIEGGIAQEYRLYKKTAVDEFVIAQLPADQLDYVDAVDLSNIYDANACYFVEAIGVLPLPDGTAVYTRSRSNTACLEQSATVRFPNALAPNGVNRVFKPVIAFPDLVAEYELGIYDRWGKRVYLSANPDEGWNGRNSNDKSLPQGVYVYEMRLTQTDGRVLDMKGTVLLLR